MLLIVSACTSAGDRGAANQLVKRMKQENVNPNVMTYNLLMNSILTQAANGSNN